MDERRLEFTRDEPVLAWRLFRVRATEDGLALGPPMIHSPTPPPWERGLAAARCIEHEHDAPAPHCRCGIYAAVEGTLDSLPGYLDDTAYDVDPWAYAEIACSGTVFLDARGLRCAEARLVRVVLVEESFASPEDGAGAVASLAARYGVPVTRRDTLPPWLTANLRRGGPPPEEEEAGVDLDALARTLVAE
jgi:hypothetical protein